MAGADPTPTPANEPNERLAIAVQSLYLARGMSLADPETAAAYQVALQAVALLIVDGARKKGRLGEEEHRLLRAFLDAAELAPGYLTGTHTA